LALSALYDDVYQACSVCLLGPELVSRRSQVSAYRSEKVEMQRCGSVFEGAA
jgi:hypothetical protein